MSKKFPLFEYYPQLKEKLPYVSLAVLPTPVDDVTDIVGPDQCRHLYIKRDDISSIVYGGNKVRKLEFLLGEAVALGVDEVVTLGFAGSNHAVATAIYSNMLGLKCKLLLMKQPNGSYVKQNLLADNFYNSELCHYKNFLHLLTPLVYCSIKNSFKKQPESKIIPAGGTSPLGVIGYVNAAYELYRQIKDGVLKKPDIIYVPFGSMGTAIGLMVGIKALNLKTKVIGIRVIEKCMANPKRMLKIMNKTVRLLRTLAPEFPNIKFELDDISICDDYIGRGYAYYTEQGARAAEFLKRKTGLVLNGAYSAKGFAALMSDMENGVLKDKTVLYWNTYNSQKFDKQINRIDYHSLPKKFHFYFENDVQELDEWF